MGIYGRPDYDQRPPFGDIGDEEPVFVMRAKDRAAPAAVRHYALQARLAGASEALVSSVERHAQAMEDYQARHGSKVPDISDGSL